MTTKEDADIVDDQCFKLTMDHKPPDEKTFVKLLLEQKVKGMKARGKRVLDDSLVTISKNSIKKVKTTYNIGRIRPDWTTDARMMALRDVRLTYKTACMIEALAGNLTAHYKWNSDATTIECKNDGSDKNVIIFRDRNYEKPITSSQIPSDLGILIKWMHMCNAAGDSSPLVTIIAVKNMPPDTFFVRKVLCLTNSSGNFGWLYFSRTKGGCAELWRHWFENVAFTTMKNMDELHQATDINGEPSKIFFETDGEAIILNQVIETDLMDKFEAAKMVVMKGPAAGTSKHQPCDVSSNFKNVKAGIKTVTEKSINTSNPTLTKKLKKAIQEFNSEYPQAAISNDFMNLD